jgi:hypothetical protein
MSGNMVRVSQETYLILRSNSAQLQFELGRQVSMGEVIAASLQVIKEHPNEMKSILTKDQSE